MSVMNDIKNKKYINQDLLVYFFILSIQLFVEFLKLDLNISLHSA